MILLSKLENTRVACNIMYDQSPTSRLVYTNHRLVYNLLYRSYRALRCDFRWWEGQRGLVSIKTVRGPQSIARTYSINFNVFFFRLPVTSQPSYIILISPGSRDYFWSIILQFSSAVSDAAIICERPLRFWKPDVTAYTLATLRRQSKSRAETTI
jgi:hypothetical protein